MPDPIEPLRVILREVEETAETAYDCADLAELRRILVHRIAELEIAQSRSQEAATMPELKEDDYRLAG